MKEEASEGRPCQCQEAAWKLNLKDLLLWLERENSPLRLPQEVFAASRSLLSFSVRAALFGWLTDDLLRTGGRPASIFRYHVGTSLFRVWTSRTVPSLSQEFSCHPRRSTPPR